MEKNTNEASVRRFDTGATRDADTDKNDYEGFLSPLALEAYGDYMRSHQKQSDGSVRDSDNWQKGIPKAAYVKSLLRHTFVAWRLHRGYPVKAEKVGGVLTVPTLQDALCAVIFNAMGLLHEMLRGPRFTLTTTPPIDPATYVPAGPSAVSRYGA